MQGLLSFQTKGRIFLHKSKHRSSHLLKQNNGNVKLDKNAKDLSLISTWNNDPLMDHKQLVVMVFKEDAFTGRPSLRLREDFLNAASPQGCKEPSKGPVAKHKIRDTCLASFGKYSRATQQEMRPHPLQGSVDRVLEVSPSNLGIKNSISEAAVLFSDFCSGERDFEKPEIKKTFQSGPNPTQLSSVLLELREEVRFYPFMVDFCCLVITSLQWFMQDLNTHFSMYICQIEGFLCTHWWREGKFLESNPSFYSCRVGWSRYTLFCGWIVSLRIKAVWMLAIIHPN